jgi:hypothetical protein
MAVVDRLGRQIPFFVEHFSYEDIRTADFDPITSLHDAYHVHPTVMTDTEVGVYEDRGFLVRPDTDGALFGITFYQYTQNKRSLTGLLPQQFLASANTWIECPFVKVYAKNAQSYTGASSYINVAPI